ncbi:MarR family winged helix-turn-helix transcriptional regulator [Paraburkholderia unamae]|uniref:DNA-binding MarR family transcriptional regulator n=1 Tax=Paraburkholderia unamae TaxID=219649 RepID=A0ABX5KP95_9BURK|nr:MarR family transcriptional regulator [Paraburkholderia unamae]PVX82926.1 DNA-binding MarR family transcriptional regulator [Paraburkholderia unamae]RAR61140.1 DNA-binding MarR family transcriptional regulator [Paraburkholderia unamae]CAG9268917.1 HTH-type transcriptional regulator PecS [Paraburkholderia unamae]
MKTIVRPDAVDAILAQWRRERPDLDVTAMGPIGRLKRCSVLLQRRIEDTFAEFDLSRWEFDVLATLRRSGEPFRLAPTELFSTLMITSGAMTHRLKGLETRGLIARVPNPDDARSLLVELTPAGYALIERAVEAHVANEQRILAPLGAREIAALDRQLARLLAVLEAADGAGMEEDA